MLPVKNTFMYLAIMSQPVEVQLNCATLINCLGFYWLCKSFTIAIYNYILPIVTKYSDVGYMTHNATQKHPYSNRQTSSESCNAVSSGTYQQGILLPVSEMSQFTGSKYPAEIPDTYT